MSYASPFRQQPQDKPGVMRHGTQPAVVLYHDAEAFFQRVLLVACGKPFGQVVNKRQVRVVQHFGLLHDADAPIKVRRVAIAQVVGHHTVTAWKECLVAYQHPLAETLPRQYFGGGKAAHTQEMSFVVYQFRLAIEDIGQLGFTQGVRHALQGVIFVKAVSGVEEAEVVARGQSDAFVHGVIQALVRFAHYGGDAVAITVDNVHGVVFGRAVYDDVLHVVVRLRDDTLYGVLDDRLRVVAHGDDTELGCKMVEHDAIVFQSICYRGRCNVWPRCLPSNG